MPRKKKDLSDLAVEGAKQSVLPSGLSAAGSIGLSAAMGVAPHLVLPMAAASALGTTTVNSISHMIKEKQKEQQEKKALFGIGKKESFKQEHVHVYTNPKAGDGVEIHSTRPMFNANPGYVARALYYNGKRGLKRVGGDDLTKEQAAAVRLGEKHHRTGEIVSRAVWESNFTKKAFDTAFTKRAQEYGLSPMEADELLVKIKS